jgi:hypothetical protein
MATSFDPLLHVFRSPKFQSVVTNGASFPRTKAPLLEQIRLVMISRAPPGHQGVTGHRGSISEVGEDRHESNCLPCPVGRDPHFELAPLVSRGRDQIFWSNTYTYFAAARQVCWVWGLQFVLCRRFQIICQDRRVESICSGTAYLRWQSCSAWMAHRADQGLGDIGLVPKAARTRSKHTPSSRFEG